MSATDVDMWSNAYEKAGTDTSFPLDNALAAVKGLSPEEVITLGNKYGFRIKGPAGKKFLIEALQARRGSATRSKLGVTSAQIKEHAKKSNHFSESHRSTKLGTPGIQRSRLT